jgi:uncharacterized protein (TIGR02266 family)
LPAVFGNGLLFVDPWFIRSERHNELSRQRKILLADDVSFFLTLEKSFLQREGVEILVARNGLEAYDLINLHRPDLALLDLYMPEMNGDDCCRQVKNNPELCDIPIIMVTTAGKENEQTQCLEAGCDEIMLKPIHRRIFVETVNKFLKVDERVDKRSPVRMQVIYGQDALFTGYTVNLSMGGLYLQTDSPLPPEESLTLKFHSPNQNQPICCSGSVAWVNSPDAPCCPSLPPGMGIKFVELKLEDMHRIRALLQPSPQD